MPRRKAKEIPFSFSPFFSFGATEKIKFLPHFDESRVDTKKGGMFSVFGFFALAPFLMTSEQIRQILSAYPDGFQTAVVTPLFPSAALGRCRYWMVETDEGTFCLRRWPREQTNIERLQFIQAVLWHAVYEGIETVPLPLETRQQKGIVPFDGSFWELLPWIDDAAETSNEFSPFETEENEWENYIEKPFQIVAAMVALAQFHEATVNFPLPDPPQSLSPGINERLSCCRTWTSERLATLQGTLEKIRCLPQNDEESRLVQIGLEYLRLIAPLSVTNVLLLSQAVRLPVHVQPVIRNACLRHLRFDKDGVCGMIDFTEIGVDTVAVDVATLLGSLACEDAAIWDFGLKAYQAFRPLSDNERFLTNAFDASQMFLEGIGYLDAVFLKEEPFTAIQLTEIQRRLERLILRLRHSNRHRRSA